MDENDIRARIEASIEAHGFTRRIAGDADFDAVLRATAAVLGRQKIGIYFAGAVGVGKTAAARAASAAVAELGERSAPIRITAYSTEDMKRLDETAESAFGRMPDHIVDDIGTDVALREYGNSIDPFAKFVMAWDARIDMDLPTSLLYVTTNANKDAVVARYGARVFDRLAWRLAVCNLSGGTKRGSVGSPWRTERKSDGELRREALRSLEHTGLMGDEFFAAGDALVEKWKREDSLRGEFFRLAAALAQRMTAR